MTGTITTRAYARIGFMGNPSDGYFGKTIACAITNFWAEVTLWESPTLQIKPHPVHDPLAFVSFSSLAETVTQHGYYGGVRLILAACKRFYEYCRHHHIPLGEKNWTIAYETTIPRQVGLGGSSAIITAVIKALMQFYALTDADIPKPRQADLIWRVELEELGIAGGLQDRVVQVYGGTVFMDFSRELMEQYGHGRYEYLDSRLLPPLFLAYAPYSTPSGIVHGDVRRRYEQNDPEVVQAMQTLGEYAQACRMALAQRDFRRIGELMKQNFALRRRIYGDAVLGEQNLQMIAIACRLGCPAKFAGSSGSVIGLYHTEETFQCLAQAYQARGFSCVKVTVDPGPPHSPTG
ncbi:MAG: hypothetical protein D6736_21875 [Nitrospinota bacterium]|nr:MAG: hypothetical protein D6736_21875 [Nitrospinota bacterium]